MIICDRMFENLEYLSIEEHMVHVTIPLPKLNTFKSITLQGISRP